MHTVSEYPRLDPGSNRPGTNPEQLFAAGWSACLEGALGLAANVELNQGDDGCFLTVRLNVRILGLPGENAQQLIDRVDETCLYSKMVRSRIEATVAFAVPASERNSSKRTFPTPL